MANAAARAYVSAMRPRGASRQRRGGLGLRPTSMLTRKKEAVRPRYLSLCKPHTETDDQFFSEISKFWESNLTDLKRTTPIARPGAVVRKIKCAQALTKVAGTRMLAAAAAFRRQGEHT
jgi:hypothetical protein